ncbi:MAG: cysteine--tRNA ligase [Pseudomonadota bacterium]
MSSLKIYNMLARQKQVFRPIEPGIVRLYVCGMTIYDYCHIGHARMMMAFDVVYRWLRTSGYAVTYVRNITDIDDKIIRRAQENGETIGALTQRFTQYMHQDTAALNMLPPTHEPRATDYVPQMLDMIDLLEKRELAYVAADGDVNFAVRNFPDYGKLSGKSLDDLRAGERVDINTGKRDPLDFVLWKSAKAEDPEAAKWASRWGSGRPGWHIECSAMACALLGARFDIHGGGADLQFPHHENEIAQSEGALGHPHVNYWMHNGFVRVDNEKMSKSLGNFFTIREVLARYDAEVLRFFILRSHYRSPLNYSDMHLDDARQALIRLYTALHDAAPDTLALEWDEPHAVRFAQAMDDDFNTPLALAVLFELATELNRNNSPRLARQLIGLGAVLGLLEQIPQAFLQGGMAAGSANNTASSATENVEKSAEKNEFPAMVEAAIASRASAKHAKNFAEADRIRADLLAIGVILEDQPGGATQWRKA